jgi:trans-aconitate methyltransferase
MPNNHHNMKTAASPCTQHPAPSDVAQKPLATQEVAYSEYLQKKYLPFRDQYLFLFYYPKLLRQFNAIPQAIVADLGCGLGSFLRFCQKRNIAAKGYDNNQNMVELCKQQGLNVEFASVLEIPDTTLNACFCDNVLEHLTQEEIEQFFAHIKLKMAVGGRLVVVVPGKAGYKTDPTHKTFVTYALMDEVCRRHGLKLAKTFYTPLNYGFVAKFLYLNMLVLVIDF